MQKNAALVIELLSQEKFMAVATEKDGYARERKVTFAFEDPDVLEGEALVAGEQPKSPRVHVPIDFETPDGDMESFGDMLCMIAASVSPLDNMKFFIYKKNNEPAVAEFELLHQQNAAPVVRQVQ